MHFQSYLWNEQCMQDYLGFRQVEAIFSLIKFTFLNRLPIGLIACVCVCVRHTRTKLCLALAAVVYVWHVACGWAQTLCESGAVSNEPYLLRRECHFVWNDTFKYMKHIQVNLAPPCHYPPLGTFSVAFHLYVCCGCNGLFLVIFAQIFCRKSWAIAFRIWPFVFWLQHVNDNFRKMSPWNITPCH